MKKIANPISYSWVALSIVLSVLSIETASAQRSITLLSPNGGEVWTAGTIQRITWLATGIDTVRIEYSPYGPTGPWVLLGIVSDFMSASAAKEEQDLPTKLGESDWLIVATGTSSNCRVRVSRNSDPSIVDMSDLSFTVYLAQQFTNWFQQSSGTTRSLNSVKTVDQSIGWIGGNSGTVLRTTNRGSTWNSVGGTRIGTADVYAIEAVDANRALVATAPNATYIIRTTNGGNTWDTVFTHAGSFIYAIRMSDANNGIAIGDPVAGFWLVKRTTDGGSTWFSIQPQLPAFSNESINGLASLSVYVWFGSSRGKVYRSTNYGEAWSYPYLAILPDTPAVTAIHFNSINNGLVGSQQGLLYKSTDAGTTWTQTPQALPHAIWGITGIPGTPSYWAISGRNIYATSNSGTTWDSTGRGYIGSSVWNSISMFGPSISSNGWAVSAIGSIVNYMQLTENRTAGEYSPTPDYSLSQVFPNPFNPETRIQFDIQKAGFVTLKIYDLLGKEVSTLVNEEKPPGTYDIAWNADIRLASGVYFCRFTVGGFAQTRKLLLLR